MTTVELMFEKYWCIAKAAAEHELLHNKYCQVRRAAVWQEPLHYETCTLQELLYGNYYFVQERLHDKTRCKANPSA
jgi:hypothetical protein